MNSLSQPWLHIVGIGEDGMDGLTAAARSIVSSAEVIIGGERHHKLSEQVTAERMSWPHPFDALIETLKGLKGKRVVVLATGDPLWFSVGARIGRSIPRLLILTTGAETPAKIAEFLSNKGFGGSRMTVLAAMGGENEKRFDGVASSWAHQVPEFNTLAVECVADPDAALMPRIPGLADDLFVHDGTMTKREIRAVTLAKLMPMRGDLYRRRFERRNSRDLPARIAPLGPACGKCGNSGK